MAVDLHIQLLQKAVYTSVDGRLVQLDPEEVEALIVGLLAARPRAGHRRARMRRRLNLPPPHPAWPAARHLSRLPAE
jgi:hypothetical protein